MSLISLVSRHFMANIFSPSFGKTLCCHKFNVLMSSWFCTLGRVSQGSLSSKDYHSNSLHLSFSTSPKLQSQNKYSVTFVKASGDRVTAKGKEGDSLLDVIVNNNLDFDGFGACEGTLTCSTCHCIFKQEDYDKLPEKPSDEELDMLDLAYELTDTSRLGCQIQLSKELDGVEVKIPATINDARS